MTCAYTYLLVWLALGLSPDAPREQAAETEPPDIELLEFLGSLEDSDAEWEEFFGSMSEQIDAEEESDAH